MTPKRGFSTLEMLIAMAILISAFTVTLLLSSAQSLSVDAETSNEAIAVARKALETQQSLARKDFKLVVATTSNETVDGSVYTKIITVTEPNLFTKKIKVTVSWKGTHGRNPTTSLSAIITNFTAAVGGDTCYSTLADSNGTHSNWKTPASANASVASLVSDSNTNGPYPISDIDAYQKRLYITVATSSSSAGTRNPASGVDTNTPSVGTLTWSNPSRVTAKDSSNATLVTNGTAVSHYLKATNFGFTIPPGSTVVGIKVDIYESGSGNSSTNAVVDSQVKLVKADESLAPLNQATSVRWSTTAGSLATYGSATDLWGEINWTPAAVNSPNFGVVLAATGNTSSANRVASVDSMQITVYYTKQFYIFDITNPAAPVYLGGLSTSTLSSSLNALAVATSSVSNYAYVATNSTSATNQLQVIDIKNPATPYVRATYPATAGTGMGKGVGTSIFYKDGYAYVGLTTGAGGPEFNIIDVSSPAVPQWKGGYSVGNTVNTLYIKDGYAYLTTNDLTKELIILNISNPTSPTLVGTYNITPDITGWGFGRALYTVGDTVYMGRSWTNSGSTPQFVSLNASTTPILPSQSPNSKTLGTNFSLNGIVVRDSLAFLLTGSQTSGGALQIITATSTATYAPTVSLPNGTGGVGGVALDCERNYIYAASVDALNRGWITNVTGL